ncbi:MAG: PAS domain S-box protein [Planctomycetaceae bacterium]|nr:PAS domain S-box protein [Planctomycetaceae bacterium]
MSGPGHSFVRHDLLELAASYAEYSVLVTTSELELPGPQILYVNTSFTRMTGYAVSELLGKTPRILQGPATDRKTLARLRTALAAGEDFIARAVNYKRDGTPFELEWIISPLKDSEGRTTHYIALQRDITGKQRAEHEIQRFDQELRQASAELTGTLHRLEKAEETVRQRERLFALGEVTAGVVHDIGNALTPVFSLIQLLHSLDQMPSHAQRYLQMLDTSAQHAIQLLNNLRHFYSERDDRKRTTLSLRNLLQHLPKLTTAKWEAVSRGSDHRIQFELDLHGEGAIVANETEMTQVFVNLVSNAVDAMPDGGVLRISLVEDADSAVVSVTDTGTGVPPEISDRIFEPYVTTKSAGTGLGLCLSRRIIEAHGGTLTVAPNPSGGTVFTAALPLKSSSTTEPELQPALRSQRVLCIDSDRRRQEPLTVLLRKLGHLVDTAESGDDGLRQFFDGGYDVVFAAQDMQPTSGRDVIQTIRRAAPGVATVVTVGDGTSAVEDHFPEYLHPDTTLILTSRQNELEETLRKVGLLDTDR